MKFNLHRFVEIVDRIGPAVLPLIPGGGKIASIVPKIVQGIKEAEALAGASGADKKQHVLNSISADADTTAIASHGIDTVIEAVHVVEGAKATRPGEVAAPLSAAGVAGAAAGSLPGVDTLPRSSDLPGGKATHGHGSGDHVPTAPAPGVSPSKTDQNG